MTDEIAAYALMAVAIIAPVLLGAAVALMTR